MTRFLLAFAIASSLYGRCQTFADSSLYKTTSAIPAAARIEGWSHGSINANGITIDLSELTPWPSPDFDEIKGWSLGSRIDGSKPNQIFHFYIQYDNLDVTFAYNLLVEPIEHTDKVRCTFSALTDPPDAAWRRNKGIVPIALPADLTPVIIKSGDVISITTLPLGDGKIAVVHYLRLNRIDLTVSSAE